MASNPAAEVSTLLEEIRTDLYGRVIPFWLAHSVDAVNGGFFNNLDVDGAVFDTKKHIWLQVGVRYMRACVCLSARVCMSGWMDGCELTADD
jgi:mannose/cellobiose epimerase-like protein (N-acyl-D-glucosamine 2-epimerase family)